MLALASELVVQREREAAEREAKKRPSSAFIGYLQIARGQVLDSSRFNGSFWLQNAWIPVSIKLFPIQSSSRNS